MYKLKLILKYLRRKLAPIFAILAVMLCTAMVIVVISVMGGFLSMMRSSAQTISGQVSVTSDLTGFAHYQQLAAMLQKQPEIQAVSPLIRSYGLLKIANNTRTVEVVGIKPKSFNQVTAYQKSLYWHTKDFVHYVDKLVPPQSMVEPEDIQALKDLKKWYQKIDYTDNAMTFSVPKDWQQPNAKQGIVLGIEVSPWSRRLENGQYDPGQSLVHSPQAVTLTVLPVTSSGSLATLRPAVAKLVPVNEFKSGLYDIDANRVYIPFKMLQKMLQMQAEKVWEKFNPETGEPLGEPSIKSAKTSELMIKGAVGMSLEKVEAVTRSVVSNFIAQHTDQNMLFVQTWEQRHATLLNAVEKEKGMLTILFSIISLVAVVMIAVIFYMIVQDKTRDIGTLRALGASRSGIAIIFLGYGLAIGVIGAMLGLGLSSAIVYHLNEIQDQLYVWFGFKMWDPRIYYFDRIPTQLNTHEVTTIVIAAIISSLIGSVVPAYLATRLNPVEALRYE